jgi:UDP-N-acetylmuramate--alanine ligase
VSSRSDTPDTSVSLVKLFPDGLRGKRIHAVGAGGSGISAVLRLAAEQGAFVTGCDVAETTMSKRLNAQGVQVQVGHDPAHVAGCDLVVTTPAVTFLDDQHPELMAARKQGIPVIQWQELLGYLMRDSFGVSVAGVHGKGSTTALLGALAIASGLDPTVEVGAVVSDWDANLRVGAGRYFINEADEFNYNFLNYHPRVVALTAVEFDHPEFFDDYTAIRDAFVRFLRGMDLSEDSSLPPPALALNADSPGCLDTLRQLREWPGVVRTFALEEPDAYSRAEDIRDDTETSFTLRMGERALGRVTLSMPGRHNIANALAAATTAELLGAEPETFVSALNAFGGLRRRFQVIMDGDVTFIDDYAHHPHAVALMLEATRRRFPGRRIVAVFQPTLYTRLYRFLTSFSEAFDAADVAIIVETQPSRERDTGLIHGRDLVAKIAERPVYAGGTATARYGGDVAETAALLREIRQPGDVVVVMGSGPVNAVIPLAMKEREAED